MELRIITLAPEHAKHVQRLSGQLGYPMSIADIESNIAEVIASKDHIAFVAVRNEKLIGWIHAFKGLFLESRPFIEIAGLVVDEEHRGQGVGRELVQKVKDWCLEKGIASLRVRSQMKRKEAHRFYIDLGFVEIKEQKVFQIQL